MTHELAVASGEREEANQAEPKTKKAKKEESLKEPYHGVDIFTKQLEYMNKVVQNINDPMHEIANTVKDILNLLMNEGSMKYSDKRRQFEQSNALNIMQNITFVGSLRNIAEHYTLYLMQFTLYLLHTALHLLHFALVQRMVGDSRDTVLRCRGWSPLITGHS